jgi:hypothetical protein
MAATLVAAAACVLGGVLSGGPAAGCVGVGVSVGAGVGALGPDYRMAARPGLAAGTLPPEPELPSEWEPERQRRPAAGVDVLVAALVCCLAALAGALALLAGADSRRLGESRAGGAGRRARDRA